MCTYSDILFVVPCVIHAKSHQPSKIILKWLIWKRNSNNPKICLVTGSGFFELSILCNCTSVWGTGCVRKLSWDLWASLLVNLALANCVELRCACETFVADWLLIQSVILITRHKSGTILCWGKFSKKMPLSNYFWCPMMNQNFFSILTFYISRVYDFC